MRLRLYSAQLGLGFGLRLAINGISVLLKYFDYFFEILCSLILAHCCWGGFKATSSMFSCIEMEQGLGFDNCLSWSSNSL